MAVAGNRTGQSGGARNLRVVTRRARKARQAAAPVARTPEARALAQRDYYKSQGASVAKQAYLAAPVPQRRSQVRAAKKEQRARLAAASKVLANTGSQEKAWREYQKGAQPETSAVLGIHGFRASAPARAGRQRRDIRARYDNTPAVLPINVNRDPRKAFEGFGKEQARRQKLAPEQAAADPAIRKQAKAEAAFAATGAAAPKWFRGAKAGTLFAMQQLLRPSSALGAAALERTKKGDTLGSRLHAAGQGFLHPDKHSGDWVAAAKAAHVPLPVVAGTAASIVTDPTTYIGFGAGSAAKEAGLVAFRDALASGATRETAVKAAREAFEAAPAAARTKGISVKFNAGVPFSRRLRINAATRPTQIQGHVAAATRKLGIKRVPVLGKAGAARRALRTVSPGTRPEGMDELTWHFVRQAGVEGRAGTRRAVGHAEHRLHAYDQQLKGIPVERQLAIRQAVQDVPHHGTGADKIFAAHGLSDTERAVGHEMVNERKRQYALEPGRAPLAEDAKMGFAGGAPARPAFQGSDITVTKAAVDQAKRDLAKSHRTGKYADEVKITREQLRKAHAERAAAQRQVVKENTARQYTERQTGKNAVPSIGQQRAQERLAAATQALRDAREAHKLTRRGATEFAVKQARANLATATKAHKAEIAVAQADRKAYRQWIRQTQAYQAAPHGYVHTPLSADELSAQQAAQATARGVRTRAGSSSYERARGGKLADMAPEDLARRELRIPVTQAQRALEHGRIMNERNVNDWITSLGHDVSHAEAADLTGAASRIFAKTPRGPVPIFDKFGRVDPGKLAAADAAGHDLVEVPEHLDAAIRQLARGNRSAPHEDPLSLMGAHEPESLYGKGLRGWKFAATQINPSYWIRNFLGDSYNAHLAGTVASDFKASARILRQHGRGRKLDRILEAAADPHKLAKYKGEGKAESYGRNGVLTDSKVAALAAKHGAIDTGLLRAELQAVADGADLGEKGIMARTLAHVGRANDARENIVRLATFRGALKRGMSPEEAAAWSLKHHFDYSELSHGEQVWGRNIFPFYTFMARNTPLQVRSLVERPGIPANLEKIRRGTLQAAGMNPAWSSGTEPFEQTNLPFATPLRAGGVITAAPGLPNMDLSNIPLSLDRQGAMQAAGNILGRSNPILSTGILGFLAGKQAMNMRDIPQYVPAPPGWPKGGIPGLPGSALTKIRDPRSGKEVWGMSGRFALALNIVPVGNVIAAQGRSGPAGALDPGTARAIGWASGARVADEIPAQRRITQIFDRLDQIGDAKTPGSELGRLTPKALGHKPGADWTGKIKRLNEEKTQLLQEAYRLSKSLGAKYPLGQPPAKGRGGKLKIGAFGGSGFKTGSGKFGSGTFGSGLGG